MEVESIQPEISASERIALRLAAAQMARQPSVAPPQRDDVPQTKDAAGADDSPDADAAGDVVLPSNKTAQARELALETARSSDA